MKTKVKGWKGLLIFLCLCGCLSHRNGHAQTIQLTDSLYRIFKHRPVFTAKLDSRNTFITGNRASIWGLKVGLIYHKSLTVGIGYNWLQNEIRESGPLTEGGKHVDARVRFRYVAPFIDYTFYRKGPWEAMIPLQMGIGHSFLEMPGYTNKWKRDWVMLYEPAMSVEYKFFKYFAVGGGYGYRIMLHNNRQLYSRFTSPMYVLRFRILFEEVYKLYEKRAKPDE